MKLLYLFLCSLPYEGYFILLMFFSAIYLLLIAPIIFWLLIIPRIENRYRDTLDINPNVYYQFFPKWSAPAIEISGYMFIKFMGWDWIPGIKNPQPGKMTYSLKRINYDIHTASKAEIIMTCLTVFFFFSLIFSGIIVAIKC